MANRELTKKLGARAINQRPPSARSNFSCFLNYILSCSQALVSSFFPKQLRTAEYVKGIK